MVDGKGRIFGSMPIMDPIPQTQHTNSKRRSQRIPDSAPLRFDRVEYLKQLCQENAIPFETIEAAQQGQRKDAGRSYRTAWSCWAQFLNAEDTSIYTYI